MGDTLVRRSKLYSMVWERPMTQIGAALGISGNGLKKICIKHEIPRPPAGYFLTADRKRSAASPLTNPNHDPTITITATENTDAKAVDTRDLIVPEHLDPDIVKAIDDYVREMKKNATPDQRGILRATNYTPEGLLRVSPSQLVCSADRLKSLLSILKANGATIAFRMNSHPRYYHPSPVAYASWGKGSTEIRVEEASTRRMRRLTEAEAKKKKQYDEKGWSYYTRDYWIYSPTGKPQLLFGYGRRRALTEDVAAPAQIILEELKRLDQVKIQNEIDRRHEKAKSLLKLRPLRRKMWRRRQLDRIEKEAERWEQADRLRRYVSKVQQMPDRPEIVEWLDIATRLIGRICPIQSNQYAIREPLPRYDEVRERWNQLHQEDY